MYWNFDNRAKSFVVPARWCETGVNIRSYIWPQAPESRIEEYFFYFLLTYKFLSAKIIKKLFIVNNMINLFQKPKDIQSTPETELFSDAYYI